MNTAASSFLAFDCIAYKLQDVHTPDEKKLDLRPVLLQLNLSKTMAHNEGRTFLFTSESVNEGHPGK